MNSSAIPSNVRVFPCARPVTLEGGGSAVLLMHGWTGWTGRVLKLGERLNEAGFTVRLPRLPGHGTSLADFRSSTWRDWHRAAIDEFIDLRDRSETVCVAGTSMGAVLAILLGAQFNVPRVALLAPAVLMRNPLLPLAGILQYIVPRIPSGWDAANDPDPNSAEIGAEYKKHNYTRQIADLHILSRKARAALCKLRSDTLVLGSERDEVVPPSVVEYVTRRIPAEKVRGLVLKKSPHQMVQGSEGETVCSEVVQWFTERR